MEGIILFALVFLLLAAGYPVAFTLGGVSMSVLYLSGSPFLEAFPSRVFGVQSNQLLVAVPLFVFMGVMFERSGLAESLLETMALLLGRVRAGLAMSVIVVGALLGASTGIVGATVVTMGLLSLPTMLKRRYSPEAATGAISAAGTLGQIVPPSIVLVLLGDVLNVSIGDLFLGAIIPSAILIGLYLAYLWGLGKLRPESAPMLPAEELAAFKGAVAVKQTMTALVPPLLLMISVLGAIFAGVASPTEAAGVGALGATLITLARGRLNRSTIEQVTRQTTFLTVMVFTILVGASAFGLAFRGLEGDRFLQDLIVSADLPPQLFVAMFLGVIFVAGFFIDYIEITFIHVPIAAPIFALLGVDLVWIGVLIAVNLQTSFLTPPFGFSLFYLKGVAPPEVETRHIYRGIVPYVAMQLVGLSVIFLIPETVTWLPEVFEASRRR